MTNEQLAESIKKDGKYELLPILWKNVKKFTYIKADKYFYYMPDKFRAAGADIWDLRQELYFAFLEGLKYYDINSQLKFVTFLEFPIKNAVKRLIGGYGRKSEPLNDCESIFETVNNSDEMTISDSIADETNIFDIIESHSESEIIRAEVEKLPENKKIIIKQYYFNNKTDNEIAEALGTTSSNVSQLRRNALSVLSRSPLLKLLYYC